MRGLLIDHSGGGGRRHELRRRC